MRARILTFLLVLAMLPTTAEFIEIGVHLAQHGDFAHAADEHNDPIGADEHGCAGAFHVCSCCRVSATLGTAQIIDFVLTDTPRDSVDWILRSPDGLGSAAPPIRPPIAS